jgi:hypothetical protein
MSRIKPMVDSSIRWLAANVRSFGYLLPDSLEVAVYVLVAVYSAFQIAQQQL